MATQNGERIDTDETAYATATTDVEEKDLFVLAIGNSMIFGDRLSMRVEGRLIGDQSVSVAAGYRF